MVTAPATGTGEPTDPAKPHVGVRYSFTDERRSTLDHDGGLQAAWLARFGRAVATEAIDALGDRIERRSQARSRSGDTDLLLLTSFLPTPPPALVAAAATKRTRAPQGDAPG